MEYSIWLNNTKIPVSEAIYKIYWKGERKERYFVESDIHNHTFSYDALDNEGMNGSDLFCDRNAIPVEEQVITKMDLDLLIYALSKLSKDELYIIIRIYYYDDSLRKLSKDLEISLSTLHYRHQNILKKLKHYIL